MLAVFGQMADQRVVAFIPARGGSTRIPRKNMRPLGGKPLIDWTIAVARDAGLESYVITDDREIAAHALGLTNVLMEPPVPDLGLDIRWVRMALREAPCEAFMILRPTSPFRTKGMIQHALDLFFKERPDSLRAVSPVKQNPYKMWETDEDGCRIVPILKQRTDPAPWHDSPSQLSPKVYLQNSSLEIAWRATVEVMGTISGNRVLPYFTEYPEDLSVDSEDDWTEAESYVLRRLSALRS